MKNIKLFMASPDDIQEERKIFVEVIESLNRSRANREGLHLEPILWEKYAYPEAENPQQIINKLFNDAQLVVVAFGNKFGEPTKKFLSGTTEEFFLALEKRMKTGLPSIKIYFRKFLAPTSLPETNEIKKILEFKESIKDVALYKDYSSPEDFRSLLHEHINAWITDQTIKTTPHDHIRVLTEPVHCKPLIKDYFNDLERKYDGDFPSLYFGLECLDNVIGSLENINLLVIAGDSSSGKTSLILTLIKNATILNKFPTLLFSTKETKEEIIHKFTSNVSQVKSDHLRNGTLSMDDWIKITNAAGCISEANLFIDDNPLLTIDELRNQIINYSESHKIKLIIIDGLNYITTDNKKLGQSLRIISRNSKIPIVVTVPLPISTQRADKSPRLADLDFLHDIKSEADIILFLLRRGAYHVDKPSKLVDIMGKFVNIIVAKNKAMPCCTSQALFLKECCCFKDFYDVAGSNIEQ